MKNIHAKALANTMNPNEVESRIIVYTYDNLSSSKYPIVLYKKFCLCCSVKAKIASGKSKTELKTKLTSITANISLALFIILLL